MLDKLAGMFDGNKLAALDIGTSSIKVAEVDSGPRGVILKKFSVYPVPEGMVASGEIADIGAVGQTIQTLLKIAKIKTKNASTGLNGSSVIVKKISMPKMDDALVAEQIKWEAEQYIPFDINEISLDHHVLKGRFSAESMEVLLVAVKQDSLFRAIEAIELGGLKLILADVAGFALANCFEANYGVMNESVALLNIGGGITNFVIVEKGEVVFCRDIVVGGDYYTSEISKIMSVSMSEAEALKISAALGQEAPEDVLGIIASANERMIDEIRNSFEFFSATSANSSPLARCYVTGGSMGLPGLLDGISKAINIQSEILNPFLKVGYDTKALSPDYISQIASVCPIAIGLGLRKMGDR